MRKYIVTITSKNYLDYTKNFVDSVRDAGWNDGIIVFTSDDIKVEGNCNVVRISQRLHSKVFNDARWLKAEFLNYFNDGDRIVYMDSDILVRSGFDKIFDYGFASAWTEYDNVNDIKKAEGYLGCKLHNGRYFDAVVVAEVNSNTRRFFDEWKRAMAASIEMGRGTVCAFNIAIKVTKVDIKKLPQKYHFYTLDGLDNIPDSVCIVHYAGGQGKLYWAKKIKK